MNEKLAIFIDEVKNRMPERTLPFDEFDPAVLAALAAGLEKALRPVEVVYRAQPLSRDQFRQSPRG